MIESSYFYTRPKPRAPITTPLSSRTRGPGMMRSEPRACACDHPANYVESVRCRIRNIYGIPKFSCDDGDAIDIVNNYIFSSDPRHDATAREGAYNARSVNDREIVRSDVNNSHDLPPLWSIDHIEQNPLFTSIAHI